MCKIICKLLCEILQKKFQLRQSCPTPAVFAWTSGFARWADKRYQVCLTHLVQSEQHQLLAGLASITHVVLYGIWNFCSFYIIIAYLVYVSFISLYIWKHLRIRKKHTNKLPRVKYLLTPSKQAWNISSFFSWFLFCFVLFLCLLI